MTLEFWRTGRVTSTTRASAQGGNTRTRAQGRTLHVDALFLAKGGAEVLDLCGEAALYVLRGEGLVTLGVEGGGGEGMGGVGEDALDEGLAVAEVLRRRVSGGRGRGRGKERVLW